MPLVGMDGAKRRKITDLVVSQFAEKNSALDALLVTSPVLKDLERETGCSLSEGLALFAQPKQVVLLNAYARSLNKNESLRSKELQALDISPMIDLLTIANKLDMSQAINDLAESLAKKFLKNAKKGVYDPDLESLGLISDLRSPINRYMVKEMLPFFGWLSESIDQSTVIRAYTSTTGTIEEYALSADGSCIYVLVETESNAEIQEPSQYIFETRNSTTFQIISSKVLPISPDEVDYIRLSNDGNVLTYTKRNINNVVYIYDIKTSTTTEVELNNDMLPDDMALETIMFSADASKVFLLCNTEARARTASRLDNNRLSIFVYDRHSHQLSIVAKNKPYEEECRDYVVSPSGRYCAAVVDCSVEQRKKYSSNYQIVYLFDLHTKTESIIYESLPKNSYIFDDEPFRCHSVVFLPDDDLIVPAENKEVKLHFDGPLPECIDIAKTGEPISRPSNYHFNYTNIACVKNQLIRTCNSDSMGSIFLMDSKELFGTIYPIRNTMFLDGIIESKGLLRFKPSYNALEMLNVDPFIAFDNEIRTLSTQQLCLLYVVYKNYYNKLMGKPSPKIKLATYAHYKLYHSLPENIKQLISQYVEITYAGE